MMNERTDIQKLIAAIARRIRERRATLGITQEELADRAQLSPNYVAKIELGWKTLSLPALVSLANALNVHVSDLLSDEKAIKWLDEAHDIAYMLDDLDASQIDFLVKQLRATVDFIKKECHKD